jgi:predicted phosphodiesterase
MVNRHAEIYKEIHAGTGAIADRIRAAMVKHGITMQYRSFERLYYSWRKYHSLKPTKPVKPKLNGNLAKLENHIADFGNMLNELIPEQSNPLDLPPSQESDYKPFKLPTNHNDILLLSDIHVPYHNIQALTLALKYGLEHEVNTILLNGDIIDFYAISRFEKDPRKRNFGHEVLMTRQFLATLRKLFPNAAIYYKCGNHDVRYDHYIMRNAPDLLGMDEFNFESLMKLDELNITFIPDKQIIHAGNLTILHGHELGASVFSPVNIARGLFLRAKSDAL